jgi:hypothetical protein
VFAPFAAIATISLFKIYLLNKAEDYQLSISQSREKQRSEF